jgi:hypothetical protein
MFIHAVIKLADGTEKIVEANGKLAPLIFSAKIARYAKKENKLVKIVCDDPVWLHKIKSELKDVPVFFGFKEGEQLCTLEY